MDDDYDLPETDLDITNIMDQHSQETLRRVEQNDDTLSWLRIGGSSSEGSFYSSNSDDYSRLGAAIGNNTHLETLLTVILNENTLSVEDRGFYDGLKHNSSIKQMRLLGHSVGRNDNNHNFIVGGVLHEILKVYQENSSHLTKIDIYYCNLVNGGADAVAATLSKCINLKRVSFFTCAITDEQLLPIVEGVRGHRSLESIGLSRNRISAAGCQALATLLEDPNCNACFLDLQENHIGIDSAIAIVNSLSKNNRLRCLRLIYNAASSLTHCLSSRDALSSVLCNTSSINSTYQSNHTLESTGLIDSSYIYLILNT